MASITTSPASVTTWKLDPAHSGAEFKVRHMMISNVKGSFSGLNGTLTENPSDPSLSLSATTRINRKDFGLNWNAALEAGGFLVGDEIQITLEVEYIKG